ncbi:MAG: Ig-like domain-containing protein, partial [Bacteroidota bacterium]|nr:Ig-like domain-containing protein [Bacteroidota bacterium]
SALQYSHNTASLSNGKCISFTPNTLNYSWTGPNGFSSGIQNPSLGTVTALQAGMYNVTFTDGFGCTNIASVTLVVNPSPTITLGPNPSVCSGITSADLPYSATTGTPDQYSLNFDAAAEAQLFADLTNSVLPSSPIVITVPGAAAPGVYNATLTVRVASSTCISTSYPITVTVLGLPNAGTVNGTTPLCVAATATYTSTGNTGGAWTSTNPAVASVNSVTGFVTALTAGTTDITYTVNNGCGSPAMAFKTLTVDPIEVLNTNDSGAGSLRDIIACAGPNANITFSPSLMNQTITLTSGEILINKNLTLSGIGMLTLSISGNNASRIFQVQTGKTLVVKNMTLRDASALTNGGAVYAQGNLTLENVLLINNFENGVPKGLTVVNPSLINIIGTVDIKN